MLKYILFSITMALVYIPDSIAFDIPYGVQDPMLGSAGFKNCEGGELGFWNVIERSTPDGKRTAIYLILTTVDLSDPAYVVCVVPPASKIMVLSEGKPI